MTGLIIALRCKQRSARPGFRTHDSPCRLGPPPASTSVTTPAQVVSILLRNINILVHWPALYLRWQCERGRRILGLLARAAFGHANFAHQTHTRRKNPGAFLPLTRACCSAPATQLFGQCMRDELAYPWCYAPPAQQIAYSNGY